MGMGINSAISAPVCTPVQPGQNNQCQVREEHFDDMGTALDEVLTSVPSNPSLPGPTFMFGYTHREVNSHRSAVRVFAEEILPHFASRGYHDLVLEIFPHGQPTDQIEIEIAEFNRTGNVGQEMQSFIPILDRANFELLLRQAFQHGVRIHSGGVDYNNIFETIFHPALRSSPERMQRTINEINQNSANVISHLARNRKRVFSLNGCLHNNLRQDQASSGFGRSIAQEFPGRTIEVDLVIPELSRRISRGEKYFRRLPLSPNCHWERFIPRSGINLATPEDARNSHILVLTRR